MAEKKLAIQAPASGEMNARGAMLELVSTMTYVALCVPAQMMYGNSLTTALFYTIVVGLITYAFRKETVVQMNPTVSVTFALTGRISLQQCLGNIVAQIAGGLIGICFVAIWMSGSEDPNGLLGLTTGRVWGASAGRTFFSECVATWLFILTVVQATHKSNKQGAFSSSMCIGFGYFVALLLTFGTTGGMINPARSFASAVGASVRNRSRDAAVRVAIKEIWRRHWITWTAPLCGGFAAVAMDFIINQFPAKENTEAANWISEAV